jgi:hypothetical protein
MPDIRQWKRHIQVVIGKAGRGLEVKDLRITFEVNKTSDPIPNYAIIRIYNLSPDNEAKIKDEYDEVILNAGYTGAMQVLFRGNITSAFRYRDKNDYIMEIQAGDGDKDFRQSIMHETLAAGTSTNQLVDRAVGTFKGGTRKGVVQVTEKARIRGKVISGNTRDVLNDVARETGANWSIQDGQLTIVSTNGVLPGQAVVIRANTGMLGAPEINDKGISVKTLLNPELRVNGAVHLDNDGIHRQQQTAQALATAREKAEKKPRPPVRLDKDGIYKILRTLHKGDNRGQDWTSEIECIGLDQPIPAARTANQGTLP